MAIGAVKLQLVTSERCTVKAEIASSSLVVPAILFKRVRRISLQPTRVQKGAFLHSFCNLFRQLEAFSRALLFMTWPYLRWCSAEGPRFALCRTSEIGFLSNHS